MLFKPAWKNLRSLLSTRRPKCRGSRSVHRLQVAGYVQCSTGGESSERLEDRTLLSAGALDLSFGTNGIVETPIGIRAAAYSVAIDSQDRIVAAGISETLTTQSITVARYNPNGSLDTSFNGTGIQTTTVSALSGQLVNGVAIQADDKIVVAGSAYPSNTTAWDFAILRYNIDGSLDTSFGIGGIATTDFGTPFDFARAIAIDSDGRIVVAGESSGGNAADVIVARYNNDGSLDSTFDSDGRLVMSFGSADDYGYSVAIHDGKILVSGQTNISGRYGTAVARLNDDGSFDTTFGSNGIATILVHQHDAGGLDIAVQPDGKIVTSGFGHDPGMPQAEFEVARFNSDGTPDISFGNNGAVLTPISLDYSCIAWSVAIQANGKIVAGGSAMRFDDIQTVVVRYNPDGTLDSTFDGDGKAITDHGVALNASAYPFRDMALQTDGKIVMVGNVYYNQLYIFPDKFFLVVRYEGDLVVPPNTAPSLGNAGDVAADEGQTATNSGTWSDIDATDVVSLSASLGTVLKHANGTWSWSFDATDGPDQSEFVTITAEDGHGGVTDTTFSLTVNNLAPIANDDAVTVGEEDGATFVDVLANDTDPAAANDPLSICGVNTSGTQGAVTLSGGQVHYSADSFFESLGAGETDIDSFEYTISDGDGGSSTATVTVHVTGQNDAPTAIGTLSDVTVNQNAATSVISLASLFDDVDANDTLTITAVSSSSGLVTTAVSGNSLTLDYQANQSGTATITVTATDGSGASVSLTFDVAVLSPAQQGNAIIQLIQQWKSDGKINAGVVNSMIVKVMNSLKSYDNGHISTAGNQLTALKNEINAKVKPGGLTNADATLAISLIDALYDSMTP